MKVCRDCESPVDYRNASGYCAHCLLARRKAAKNPRITCPCGGIKHKDSARCRDCRNIQLAGGTPPTMPDPNRSVRSDQRIPEYFRTTPRKKPAADEPGHSVTFVDRSDATHMEMAARSLLRALWREHAPILRHAHNSGRLVVFP